MLCRRVTQTLTRAAMSNAVNDAVPHRTNKVLTMETLNPHIKVMEYAVRGPIVARAAQIEKELKQVGYYKLSLWKCRKYSTVVM